MKVIFFGYGNWNIPISEKKIKEAEVGANANLHPRNWTIKQHKPESLVPRRGQWIAPLDRDFVQKFAVVAGVFNLQPINYMEIKYKKESKVQCLLPCYDHEDGVFLDGYTEADGISFTITNNYGFKKFTNEDLIPEKPEKETKKQLGITAERTLLNIIAVLLECNIKGDMRDVEPHPSFKNQASLIAAIDAKYGVQKQKANLGLSKRTLEDKFAEAKKSLSDSLK